MAIKSMEPIWFTPPPKRFQGYIHGLYKDSPTAPTPPDPFQTANAQTQSNIATANANAQLNRVNQTTPWGNLTYTHTAGPQMFDQAAYDTALKKYNDALSQQQARQMGSTNNGDNAPWQYYQAGTSATQNTLPSAPNRADFMTSANTPDQWSANISLAPEQQRLLDLQNQIGTSMGNLGVRQLDNVNNVLGKPLDFNQAPSIQNGGLINQVNAPADYQQHVDYGNIQQGLDLSKVPALVGGDALSGAMRDAQQAAYKQQTAFLDPQWAQQQHDLENQLAQQGVMQNSDAWNRAMDDLQRNKAFAYNQAAQSAIGLGNTAQNQLFQQGLAANQNAYGQALGTGQFANSAQAQGFGQAMQNAQLQNNIQDTLFNRGLMNAQLNNAAAGQAFGQSQAARNQAINELMMLRQNPLNELNALRTGSQVTSPQFSAVPSANIAGTNIAGLIDQNYANQMGAYNAQVQQNNGITSGLFSLGSAAMPKLATALLA